MVYHLNDKIFEINYLQYIFRYLECIECDLDTILLLDMFFEDIELFLNSHNQINRVGK